MGQTKSSLNPLMNSKESKDYYIRPEDGVAQPKKYAGCPQQVGALGVSVMWFGQQCGYRLDIVRFNSTHSWSSGTKLLERQWTLLLL